MRLLDRYISRELLVSALFAVIALSFVLVFGQVFKRLFEYLIDHNKPASFMVTFVAYSLPASLSLTIPWGFLTAVLLVFGRLSASNELTALRAHGISTWRVARPVIILALALCGLCTWINLVVAPQAQQNLKNAFFELATSNPVAAFTSDQVITDFPSRKIYVGKKEGAQLQNLHVFELNSENQPTRVVFARRGWLRTVDVPTVGTGERHKQIIMQLEDARLEDRDAKHPDDLHRINDGNLAGNLPFPVDLEELYVRKMGRRRIDSYSFHELLDLLKARKKGVKADEKPGKASEGSAGKEGSGKRSAAADKALRTAVRTELNRRFSYSLACLTFALIGIPLGITAQRQETTVGFGLSLAIAVTYYLIMIVANTVREKAGLHPEVLVWMPNVLFLMVGGVMFYRLMRR